MSRREPGGPGSARERVAACRRYLGTRAALAAGLLVVGVLLLVLPLAWLLAGTEGWRPGSALPLLLVLGGTGAAACAALGARFALRRRLGEGRLLTWMEGAAGLPEGRLRAQLELPDSPLVAAGEGLLRAPLDRPPGELVGEGRRETGRLLRWGAGVTGVAALLALGAWQAGAERAQGAWAGLVRPLAVLHPAPLPPLSLTPGDASVPRGESVEVVVSAPGRRELRVEVSSPGVPDRSMTLAVEGGIARGHLPPVEAPLRYRVVGDDGSATPTFTLEPLDPLVLGDFTLELVYPPWTGLPPERRRAPPRHLTIPAGTRLSYAGSLGAPMEALELRSEGRDPVVFEVASDRRSFAGGWTPRGDGAWAWWAPDAGPDGGDSSHALPPPMELEVLPDAPPRVRLSAAAGGGEVSGEAGDEALPEGAVRGGEPAWLPADLRLPLLLDAEDDWGLDWVALEVTVYTPGEPVQTRGDRTELAGERAVALRPVLDLGRWELEPGSRVRLQARAADRGAGPGIGASEVLEFRVPTSAQRRDEARAQIGRTSERVRELGREASEEAARQAERLQDQIAAGAAVPPGDPGAAAAQGTGGTPPSGGAAGSASATPGAPPPAQPEALEGLRDALQGEADLLEELEALREAMGRSAEVLGGQDEDRALRRELARLEDALERLAGPEARAQAQARLEELAARMREEGGAPPSAAEAAEAMGDALERREALLEALDDLRDRLDAAERRAELEGAREAAARLADDQEARARAWEKARAAGNPTPPDPAEAADMAERARALEARLEAMEARALAREEARAQGGDAAGGERGGEAAAEALNRAREAAAEARAASEAEAAAPSAGSRAAEAAEAARRAEAALSEAAGADAAARDAALREALAGAAHQAMALEAALMAPPPEGVPPEVEPLREGARILAGELAMALVDAGEGARELAARMGAALAALDAVAERDRALQAGLPGSRQPAVTGAQSSLQHLALAALEALDRLGEGQESGEGAGGGGEGAMGEALSSLADAQDALNQAAGSLDGRPGDPTASGEAQGRMEALAREQEGIASSLGQMGEELRRSGEGGELRAEALEALAREAQALAEALAAEAGDGRPTAETLNRQDRLLERLLDSGRSMERDEPTSERRGTAAGPVTRAEVPPLPAGLLDAARIPLPSPEALARLAPAERRLVLEYLDRLSRPRGAGGGGNR